jgi:hypothetical protein
LVALEAGFIMGLLVLPPGLDLLAFPSSVENRPRIAEAAIPPSPPSPPSQAQTWQLLDSAGSSSQAVPPREDETTVAKGGADVVAPALRAEAEPVSELPVTESRGVVQLPPAPTQPQPGRPVLKRFAATTTANKTLPQSPLQTKSAKREPTGKRPSEALRTVRRFGDDLEDIPVSAHDADGTRRTVVIHPTSMQDVYYYSVPR